MSLDAIRQVTQAEEETREQLACVQADAKRVVVDAERDGKELIAQARSQAEGEVKLLLTAAETRAEAHTQEVMARALQDCDALRATAEERLDKAADLITERVVNS